MIAFSAEALSRQAFEGRFPDKSSVEHPFRIRFPSGFVCPGCGELQGDKSEAVALRARMRRSQASDLRRGRDLHASLPCPAEGLVPRHAADGRPFQRDFGVATQEPVRPEGVGSPAGGRSHNGRLPIASAAGIRPGGMPGQAKLRTMQDYSALALRRFVTDAAIPGIGIRVEGWLCCEVLPNLRQPVAGGRPGHRVLEWTRRVFSNRKRSGLGVCADSSAGVPPTVLANGRPGGTGAAAAPGRRGSRRFPGRGQPPPRLATPQTPSSRTSAAPKLPTIDRSRKVELSPSWRYQMPAASRLAGGP